MTTGTVYLVGAGPGAPGLLTLRGAEVLASANVVVHDRLTGPDLLSLAKEGVELFDVGKDPDDRGDQDAINKLLVTNAQKGLQVVRLKGGDPFVFGRGGEEALALLAAGVPFEVVPGVTSAIAAPAYAGVPVTHRGLVTSFTVVAGHSRSVDAAAGDGGTNWEALAAAGGTIVVLMGAAHRAKIADRLMRGGLPPTTPVLAVERGTWPEQSQVRTTLAGMAEAEMAAPVTIVIGEVAALGLVPARDLPLSGRTVVLTRAVHQAASLSGRLRQLGARVLEVPVIEIVPPADGGDALAAAAGRLGQGAYDWVVLTSANAVGKLFDLVPDTRALRSTSVAAVGPATAESLLRYRVVADLVPAQATAEGLLAELPQPGPAGGPPRALLPQAAGAREELQRGMERLGWAVDAVEAYRTVPRPVSAALLRGAASADAICFASPSAVDSYLDQAEVAGAKPRGLAVCIGPVTAAAARRRGLRAGGQASEHTADGLVSTVLALLGPG